MTCFCLFSAGFGLFPGALPVWLHGSLEEAPNETKRLKKIFSELRTFWARQHRKALGSCHSTLRLVEKILAVFFALCCSLFALVFCAVFLRCFGRLFYFVDRFRFWCGGFGRAQLLLHGLLDVVLEALLQICAE